MKEITLKWKTEAGEEQEARIILSEPVIAGQGSSHLLTCSDYQLNLHTDVQ